MSDEMPRDEMAIEEPAATLADVVDRVRDHREQVYLTRDGTRVAAVIDADALDRLIEAAEDLSDLLAVRASREETAAGAPTIPWEQIKAELGSG